MMSAKDLMRVIDPKDPAYPFAEMIERYWPASLEPAQSIVITQEFWEGHFTQKNPTYFYTMSGPALTVMMSNGATLEYEFIDRNEDNAPVETFRGDWEYYAVGDKKVLESVAETAHEILLIIMESQGEEFVSV